MESTASFAARPKVRGFDAVAMIAGDRTLHLDFGDTVALPTAYKAGGDESVALVAASSPQIVLHDLQSNHSRLLGLSPSDNCRDERVATA